MVAVHMVAVHMVAVQMVAVHMVADKGYLVISTMAGASIVSLMAV